MKLHQESEMVLEMERKALKRKMEQAEREEAEKQRLLEEQQNQQEKLQEALFKRIVESSTEIQSLEGELRKKLLHRDQRHQIGQNKERRAAEREIEVKENSLNVGMPQFEAREKEQDKLRKEANLLMKETLERQLIEKELRKNEEYEQYLKEKEEVKRVLAAIEQDEARKEAIQASKRQELQDSIREYKAQVAREEREAGQKVKEEEERILAYQRFQQKRLDDEERRKEEERQDRARRTAKVAEIAGREQEEADRLNELIIRLHQARMEQKRIEADRQKKAKKEEELRDLKRGRMAQRRYKEVLRRREEEEERRVEAEMVARHRAAVEAEKLKEEKIKAHKAQMKEWYDGYFQEKPDMKEAKLREWEAHRTEQKRLAAIQTAVVDDARKRLFEEYSSQLPEADLLALAQNDPEKALIRALYA